MKSKSNEYELSMSIDISQHPRVSQGLAIRESILINCESFMEIANILGQFHVLAKKIKEEKGDAP